MRTYDTVGFYLILSIFMIFCYADDEPLSDVEIKPALSQCKRINPCGATISTYPLLEPDAEESSGFGSGMVPVYDEILTHEIYDLNAAPEHKNFTLCSCDGDKTCDFEDDTNAIKVDHHVTLRFCDISSIPTSCKKNLPILRVIGKSQESGDGVQDVSNAVVFCNCQTGFTRKSIESWSGGEVSINYKCFY